MARGCHDNLRAMSRPDSNRGPLAKVTLRAILRGVVAMGLLGSATAHALPVGAAVPSVTFEDSRHVKSTLPGTTNTLIFYEDKDASR